MAQQFARDVSMDGVLGRGENVLLGALAGLVAAGVGVGIWMAVGVVYVALGVGALVGLAVRLAGNGRSAIFGLIAVTFTVLGCLGGEVMTRLQALTSAQHDFYEILTTTDLWQIVMAIVNQATLVDYAVYGVSIVVAYVLSIRS